jgi:D-alanyl-D-alanine carboxypeptidase
VDGVRDRLLCCGGDLRRLGVLLSGARGPGGAASVDTSNAAAAAVALPGGADATAAPATGLPVPAQTGAAARCDDPAVVTALAAGKDEDVVAAFGAAFRGAVVDGAAPCVDLGDPHRLWIVVDKKRPLNPLDVEPTELVAPPTCSARSTAGCSRRPPRR